MNKKQLYESIMTEVSKQVKKTLNESEVDIQQKYIATNIKFEIQHIRANGKLYGDKKIRTLEYSFTGDSLLDVVKTVMRHFSVNTNNIDQIISVDKFNKVQFKFISNYGAYIPYPIQKFELDRWKLNQYPACQTKVSFNVHLEVSHDELSQIFNDYDENAPAYMQDQE